MPFTFQPFEIKRQGGELELRGRLLTGAYFGPEAAVVRSEAGHELATHIHSHGMEYPEGWPVLPEHSRTVLVLRIPALPAGFELALLTGVGAVAQATQRIDITQVLDEPEFWAMQAALHCMSEGVDDPAAEWLGVRPDAANDWYESRVNSHILAGRWPYLRVSLPESRYIELEMAGGVEYQDRVWIGQLSGSQRVLMGYHSGHFSLPALRAAEVSWIARSTEFGASNLLWLSTAYLEDATELLSLAESLVSHVPGLLYGKEGAMSQALLSNLVVDGLSWTPDPGLGWVNNWSYSQRNPQSRLTVLKPRDFTYIRPFFP